MKQNRHKLLISALVIFFSLLNSLAASQFGEISIKINSNDAESFEIERALLYKNVSLAYDSTVIVQNKQDVQILFYPQLRKGSENFLRLIAGNLADSLQNFYDIFINLGDSVAENYSWQDEAETIYFIPNGTARPRINSSSKLNGTIQMDINDENAVSGDIDLQFNTSFPSPNDEKIVAINGNFDVPTGELENTSLASEETRKKMEGKYKKNIYTALIISIFLVAIFGLK